MDSLHDIAHRVNKFVTLLSIDHEWRRDLEDHKIVSANLRKDVFLAKQTHDDHLTKHSLMNPLKCLKSNSQSQLLWRNELNTRHESGAARLFDHFEAGESVP
jgi:hypothetical protein